MPVMMTALEFANALGRANIAEASGVGLTAVSNAVVREWFPSSWYLACKALADKEGVACPPELFKMKVADGSQYVETANGAGGEIHTGGEA